MLKEFGQILPPDTFMNQKMLNQFQIRLIMIANQKHQKSIHQLVLMLIKRWVICHRLCWITPRNKTFLRESITIFSVRVNLQFPKFIYQVLYMVRLKYHLKLIIIKILPGLCQCKNSHKNYTPVEFKTISVLFIIFQNFH